MLGLLSAAVGAAPAVRVAVLVMLTVQFVALWSAGRKLLGPGRLTFAMVVSVIWATYSLTNLYNRGALAEYLATGFFVTALAFGASAALGGDRSSRWFHGWLAGYFLLLTVGTHAPTAVLAGAFLSVLLFGAVAAAGRGAWRAGSGRTGLVVAGGLAAGAVIVAPWVAANVWFASQLALVRDAAGFIFRPENSDTWARRFVPFPYDAAAMADGLEVLGTPYLEAQINVVLLIILFWNLELARRSRRRSPSTGATKAPLKTVLMLAVGWFVLMAAISVSPDFARHFQFAAPYVQYAYRLVSHCNAALLVAVLASGVWVARRSGYRQAESETKVVAAVCLAVAVVGLGIKLNHAAAVISPDAARPSSVQRRQMEVVPAYTLPASVPALSGDVSLGVVFPVGRDPVDFGELGAARIELVQAAWVRTNAVVFPWIGLSVDGNPVPPAHIARTGNFLAVYLAAGSHELRADWQPARAWSVLNQLSRVLFGLVSLVTLGWVVARWRSRRSEGGVI
jgi:hypothetical protein